jgi:hypothetical protein
MPAITVGEKKQVIPNGCVASPVTPNRRGVAATHDLVSTNQM